MEGSEDYAASDTVLYVLKKRLCALAFLIEPDKMTVSGHRQFGRIIVFDTVLLGGTAVTSLYNHLSPFLAFFRMNQRSKVSDICVRF